MDFSSLIGGADPAAGVIIERFPADLNDPAHGRDRQVCRRALVFESAGEHVQCSKKYPPQRERGRVHLKSPTAELFYPRAVDQP
jgi:hypothetical protein